MNQIKVHIRSRRNSSRQTFYFRSSLVKIAIGAMIGFLLIPIARTARAQIGKPNYVEPGFASFDPHQKFESVGVFGSFGKGSENQERDHVGLPTFTLRKDAPDNTMVWANFVDGKDLVLGHSSFPGNLGQQSFQFIDWTTAKLKFSTISDGKTFQTEAYFSRSFPGVMYNTTAHTWQLKPGDVRFDRVAYKNASGQVVVARSGEPIAKLGAPWMVLWAHSDAKSDVIPMLVRFQKQPRRVVFESGLDTEFASEAQGILVMPLFGIHRVIPHGEGEWNNSLPLEALSQTEFWTRTSAAYPVGITENFELIESRSVVSITDHVLVNKMADDWKTVPLTVIPVSPVTALAEASGYPIKWLTKIVRSPLATLLGPFVYSKGLENTYEIPIPSARDTMLAPLNIKGEPLRQGYREQLSRMATDHPIKPDDTSDGGLNLQLKEYAQAFPLLNRTTQTTVAPDLQRAFDASFAPENLQTVTDPVTGSRYVMCNKIWCAGEQYDREWYAGRQLDATYEYTSWIDSKSASKHWKAIQGIYAYYRIYNDWAWSGALSSVFAYALCADGMNFAMEGMLGVARLAKRYGDDELWRDATYRSAKEAACTYGSWFLSDWVAKQDYVTWTDTSYDYVKRSGRYEIHRMPPNDVQTGFGLDIFSDTTGIKVFRNGSFWHASAAVYWNNPSLYRLYDESLYAKIFKWEYETMPVLHPQWLDREATEKFGNQPYGNNWVIAHLDARAILFGDSPENLALLTTKLQPDISFHYRLRETEDLAQAGAPQVWVPTAQASAQSVDWDAQSSTLAINLMPFISGEAFLDWNWRGLSAPVATPYAGPSPSQVAVQGKPAAFHPFKGGFLRLPLKLVKGQALSIRISYSPQSKVKH